MENKKPYRVNNGNYVYGVSEYDQPMVPYYNSMAHHKKFPLREFPNDKIRDDGVPYKYIGVDQICASCSKCNGCHGSRIDRNTLLTSVVNVESSIDKILTITIYGVTEDLDRTIRMKTGSKYCISYVTENGLQTVTGVFKELSSNVPDECTKYIGNFNSVTTAAYIGLDCSTAGSSDKRLIYIASIRFIEEVFEDGDDRYANYTQDEKLSLALNTLDSVVSVFDTYNSKLAELIEATKTVQSTKTTTTITSNKKSSLEGDTITIVDVDGVDDDTVEIGDETVLNTDTTDKDNVIQTEFTYDPTTKTVTLPDITEVTITTTTEVISDLKEEPKKPPMPPHPLAPYPGPLIIGARPPFGPPPTYRPYRPEPHPPKQDISEKIELEQINLQASIDALNNIKEMINSYIAMQSSEMSRDDLMDGQCDLGVPIVDSVPSNALNRDLYMVKIEDDE